MSKPSRSRLWLVGFGFGLSHSKRWILVSFNFLGYDVQLCRSVRSVLCRSDILDAKPLSSLTLYRDSKPNPSAGGPERIGGIMVYRCSWLAPHRMLREIIDERNKITATLTKGLKMNCLLIQTVCYYLCARGPDHSVVLKNPEIVWNNKSNV